jgi:hypothetical protein
MAALSFLQKHPDDSIGAERPPLNFQQVLGLHPAARKFGVEVAAMLLIMVMAAKADATESKRPVGSLLCSGLPEAYPYA